MHVKVYFMFHVSIFCSPTLNIPDSNELDQNAKREWILPTELQMGHQLPAQKEAGHSAGRPDNTLHSIRLK